MSQGAGSPIRWYAGAGQGARELTAIGEPLNESLLLHSNVPSTQPWSSWSMSQSKNWLR